MDKTALEVAASAGLIEMTETLLCASDDAVCPCDSDVMGVALAKLKKSNTRKGAAALLKSRQTASVVIQRWWRAASADQHKRRYVAFSPSLAVPPRYVLSHCLHCFEAPCEISHRSTRACERNPSRPSRPVLDATMFLPRRVSADTAMQQKSRRLYGGTRSGRGSDRSCSATVTPVPAAPTLK